MFIVHRVQKYHSINGIKSHINRADPAKGYVNKVDPSKSDLNAILEQNNAWDDKIIKDVFKARKNAVLGIEGIYTASPDFFIENMTADKEREFFEDCLKWHKEHYGDMIISAVIHYDEKTPHLHVLSIPTIDGLKLNAREILKNPQKLAQYQTEIAEQIGKKYGLQRGQEKSTTVHKPSIIYQRECNQKNWEFIKGKLKEKNAQLKEWEQQLKEKERQLIQYEQQLDKYAEEINQTAANNNQLMKDFRYMTYEQAKIIIENHDRTLKNNNIEL